MILLVLAPAREAVSFTPFVPEELELLELVVVDDSSSFLAQPEQ